MTTEILYSIVPALSAAVFAWLWRKGKKETKLAELRLAVAVADLLTSQKLVAGLRTVLAKRNSELRECREKLPPAESLDDFFNGLRSRDPGRNDN